MVSSKHNPYRGESVNMLSTFALISQLLTTTVKGRIIVTLMQRSCVAKTKDCFTDFNLGCRSILAVLL